MGCGRVSPAPSLSRPHILKVGESSPSCPVSGRTTVGRIRESVPFPSFTDARLAECPQEPLTFQGFLSGKWQRTECHQPVPVRSAGFLNKVTPNKPVREVPAALVSWALS